MPFGTSRQVDLMLPRGVLSCLVALCCMPGILLSSVDCKASRSQFCPAGESCLVAFVAEIGRAVGIVFKKGPLFLLLFPLHLRDLRAVGIVVEKAFFFFPFISEIAAVGIIVEEVVFFIWHGQGHRGAGRASLVDYRC